MTPIRIYELAKRRALVTRQSAKVISDAIAATPADPSMELTLDFEGIEAVTPSFVDELLALSESVLRAPNSSRVRILFLNAPTRLSAKFTAIARARDVAISENEDGVWSITAPAA